MNRGKRRTFDIDPSTGEHIRKCRLQKELDIDELADKADVDAKTVRGIEKGGRRFDEKTLIRIARALEIDSTSLMKPSTFVKDEGNEELNRYSIQPVVTVFNDKKKKLLVGAFALLVLIGMYFLSVRFGTISDAENEQKLSNQIKEQPLTAGLPHERQSVKNPLREILLYEIEIYKTPNKVDMSSFTDYWVPEEKGGKAIIKVKTAIRRLKDNGLYYGTETNNSELTFTTIQIFPSGDYAEVQTRERWYLPLYNSKGQRVTTRNPAFSGIFTYTLRRFDGKWLLQDSNVPYAGQ